MNGRKILSLSLSPTLLKEIQELAREEKVSKSEFLRRAVTDFIGNLKWAQAKKAGRRAARELKISEADIENIVHAWRQE